MGFWLQGGTLIVIPGPTANGDEFWGDNSDETASALGGDDDLHGGGGNDTLNGNAGNDDVWGDEGNDTLDGEDGNDTLDGGSGHDTLNGGDGADTLDGKEGSDTLSGGAGDDVIYDTSFSAEVASVWVDGGSGTDFVQFSLQDETLGVVFSAASAASASGLSFNDGSHVRNVERFDIHTGSGDDQADFGSALIGRNVFHAGDGIDRLIVDLSDATAVVSAEGFFVGIDRNGPNERGIHCLGVEAFTVTSGSAADGLAGGDGDDVLTGNGGNDTISGFNGNDTLNGGDGADTLDGHAGNDTISGGAGDDVIYTSFNAEVDFNWIDGGSGTDFVQLNLQDETLGVIFSAASAGSASGQSFNDGSHVRNAERFDLHTGSGDDQADFGSPSVGRNDFNAEAGNDRLIADFSDAIDVVSLEHFYVGIDRTGPNERVIYHGGVEAFTITGGAAGDSFTGGEGDDVFTGNGGNDTLTGYGGNDSINGGAGSDNLAGGDGIDAVAYSGSSAGVTINLATNAASGGDAAGDTLSGFENVAGSTFNDTLTGDGGANALSGAAGADTLNGGGGNDTLEGGDGNDVLQGSFGNDAMTGGLGDDYYYAAHAGDVVNELAGQGTDTVETALANYVMAANTENLILTGSANSNATGTAAANVMTGNAGANTLIGGLGNDVLQGAGGRDLLTGGGGLDRFVFTSLADSAVVFAGRDSINTFAHGDKIDLSALDANVNVAGDQAFTWSPGGLTGVAGQLYVQQNAARSWTVWADVNGDGNADFALNIYGAPALNNGIFAWDFIL